MQNNSFPQLFFIIFNFNISPLYVPARETRPKNSPDKRAKTENTAISLEE